VLKSDQTQSEGNTAVRRKDSSSATLASLAALKVAFDQVMKLLPEAHAFGKGGKGERGHTNVAQHRITQAIADFQPINNGNFPSLTIDDRNALILALRKLDAARETWVRTKRNS
jgi:hypothetical protein